MTSLQCIILHRLTAVENDRKRQGHIAKCKCVSCFLLRQLAEAIREDAGVPALEDPWTADEPAEPLEDWRDL